MGYDDGEVASWTVWVCLNLRSPRRCVRPPYFAPDGPRRSVQTQLCIAVGCHLLARRCSVMQDYLAKATSRTSG
jgi:hypothetical protein